MSIDFSTAFVIAFVSVIVAVGIFVFMHGRVQARTRPEKFLSEPSPARALVIGDTDWQSLSEREKQVARRVVAGESNKEVAQALSISPQTVNAHLKSIYQKMNVQSRMQLAARLREIEP